MQTLLAAAPDHRLAPFIRCFAQRETSPGSPPIAQALVGSLAHILSLDFCDPTIHTYPGGKAAVQHRSWLLGAHTGYAGSACLSGHVLSFGIFFRPFAPWQLFGIPSAELADLECDATAVMGSWVSELWDQLACCRSFSERIIIATDTLMRFIQNARPQTSIMSTVHRLLPSPEPARITRVARESAMSIRNYERQFASEIGMSPKNFARLARFATAIDLKRRGEDSWLNISHDVGYFDQMHMNRDFRMLGGDAPGRLVCTDSDFQPWSIPSQVSTNEAEWVVRKP
jgi:AraC-like DNA-binding protein